MKKTFFWLAIMLATGPALAQTDVETYARTHGLQVETWGFFGKSLRWDFVDHQEPTLVEGIFWQPKKVAIWGAGFAVAELPSSATRYIVPAVYRGILVGASYEDVYSISYEVLEARIWVDVNLVF